MTDYTYLVNDIISACENDGTEFLAYVPNMVNRSEERLTRDLDDYGLVVQTSIAVSASNAEITLPTGTRIVKNFNLINNGSKINLLLKTDEFLNAALTGMPIERNGKMFSISKEIVYEVLAGIDGSEKRLKLLLSLPLSK